MRIFCPRNSLLSACATALLLLTASQVVFAEKNTVQDSEGSDSDTPPAATLLKSTTSAAPEASTSTTTKTTSSTATTDSATATSDSREELSSESLIYLRARSKINKGDAAGAVTDLSALLEKSQNKPKYLRERARAFYRLKDYQKAMSDIEASLKAEQNAWAFDMRGLIKTALGDIAGAAADDTTAISLEKRPKSAYQFYYNRALTRQRQGDYKAAINDLNTSISMNPTYAKGYSARGHSHWHLKDDDSAAMKDYDKAIELDPKLTTAYINRSLIEFKKSDFKGSLDDLNKALAIKPSDVLALRNRAKTKDAMGDSAGAVADYDEALRRSGASPQTEKAQSNLSAKTGASGDLKGEQKEAMTKYMAMMQSWIKSFWEPKRGSGSKKAVVTFFVDGSGNASEIKVKESSGDTAFDTESVSTIEKADPIPAPPAFIKTPVTIEFSFIYNVSKK